MEEESQRLNPPEEQVAAAVDGKTRWRPVFTMSSAMAASFSLMLLFTITLLYSQGFDRISAFATTTFQKTFSTMSQSPPYPYKPESSLTCNSTSTPMVATCPSNYPPQQHQQQQQRNTSTPPTCPEYFRWIHEDMKPWKKQGITREMLEEIEKTRSFRHFRLTIVNGTAYVKRYDKAFQTRDTFTLWGVLQLFRLYPGKLPDVDLLFQCHDRPSIRKDAYEEDKAPPLFHYCGSDDTYDIVFPDWSFWGWPEINVKPWVSLKKDLKEGNKFKKWIDREPYAFWRGELRTGSRKKLGKCNSTKDWNALIYQQDWRKEIEEGFKNSDMSKQCKHRYKIYMEGNAWSVSQKYILACDSMTLLVNPFYYDFFTRELIPMKHYWPIDPRNICKSVKSAVHWGNTNPNQAQEIGREGTRFIEDKISMKNVYDYMFHTLTEYAKLLRYKPTVPPGAIELCSDFWVCARGELEQAYKVETMEMEPATHGPCSLAPPFEESELDSLKEEVAKGFLKVQSWEVNGKTNF